MHILQILAYYIHICARLISIATCSEFVVSGTCFISSFTRILQLHRLWSTIRKQLTYWSYPQRFLLTCVMSCTSFLSPNAFCIGFQHCLVWRSVTGFSPSYLTDLCRPVSDLASRRALRSSARGELLVPRARSAFKQRRAFSVIGPSTWNELPLTLRLLPQNNMSSFCKLLKTFLFDRCWTESASE